MKFTPWFSAVVFAVLFIAGSCSPFIKVYAEEEPGVNLYQYSTYGWLENPATAQGNSGPEWQNQHTREKIRTAVEGELQRFGFHRCDTAPDLMLHYHVVVKNEVLYVRDQWCDEDNWSRYGHCNRIRPVQYQEGMLIVDLIDSKTGNQVWRGGAVAIRENLTTEESDARIAEAIQLIFNKFPQNAIPGKQRYRPR